MTYRRWGLTWATFFFSAAFDVATKWMILNVVMTPPRIIEIAPFFNLTLGFNTGVSFGMFQDVFADRPLILVAAKLFIVAGLLVWAARCEKRLDQLGFGLVAGGAMGNVIDRARHGAVTDFLDFHLFGWHWPAFNAADSAITVGVLLLLLSGLFPSKSPVHSPTEKSATQPWN